MSPDRSIKKELVYFTKSETGPISKRKIVKSNFFYDLKDANVKLCLKGSMYTEFV